MSTLKIINARLGDGSGSHELYVENGYFVAAFSPTTSAWQTLDLQGQLLLPGLIETHIHLDKACILQRCHLHEGTLSEAIAQTRAAKATFTEEDVYQRGAQVLEKAIVQGTTYMRTHVELDPQIGLIGFDAVRRLHAGKRPRHVLNPSVAGHPRASSLATD